MENTSKIKRKQIHKSLKTVINQNCHIEVKIRRVVCFLYHYHGYKSHPKGLGYETRYFRRQIHFPRQRLRSNLAKFRPLLQFHLKH